MRVTFLGTGTSTGVPVMTCECRVCASSDPRDRRLRPSVLVEWDGAAVLVDTSTDLRQQALEHRVRRVDAVLYTHAHADHVFGFDDLRLFCWRQGGPIAAYGSEDTLAALRRTFWYAFEETPPGTTKPRVELRQIRGPFDVGGRTVVPVPLIHGTVPILGFRIGPFAYLTDVSEIPEASYALLRNLQLLVLSALRLRPHPTHFHLDRAVEEARRIGAARTLFTHVSHEILHAETAAHLPPGLELAYDGLQVSLKG